MKEIKKHLKETAGNSLERSQSVAPKEKSPIIKGTRFFFVGAMVGVLISLLILPIVGYYPNIRDGVISAIVGGIINVLSNQINK